MLYMPDDTVKCCRCYTGIPLCQRMYFCDQHYPCNSNRDRITYSHTMALQDVILQGTGIFFRDLGVTQRTEACIDAINSAMLRNDLIYICAACSNAGGHFRDD